MTDEAPKPKGKRRRWIIAGASLFVVAVAGWWNWPRGDARFVGSWVLVNNVGQSEGAYRFLTNGIAEFYGESNDSKPVLISTYRWSIDWPDLRLRPTGRTWPHGAEASLFGLGQMRTSAFKVVGLTTQAIEVVEFNSQKPMTFERVRDW